MNKSQIFKLMMENPVFHLATLDGDQPRVRGMLLYRADKNGIIFHTGYKKDVFEQLMKNPKVELCFWNMSEGIQVRVTGTVEKIDDPKLQEEIFAHPSRKFLQVWKDQGVEGMLQLFILKNGIATPWTMATNFSEKQYIKL